MKVDNEWLFWLLVKWLFSVYGLQLLHSFQNNLLNCFVGGLFFMVNILCCRIVEFVLSCVDISPDPPPKIRRRYPKMAAHRTARVAQMEPSSLLLQWPPPHDVSGCYQTRTQTHLRNTPRLKEVRASGENWQVLFLHDLCHLKQKPLPYLYLVG